MSQAASKSLVERVDRLEKQNRWLKLGCYACCLFLVCILTMGQVKSGKTVEAQRFVLKNSKGQVRAELALLDDGDYPRLTLRSPNGEKETQFSPLGVSVLDHGFSGKVPLAHFGNLGLYFTDTQGRTVMELGGAGVNTPQLAPVPEIIIFDEKGKSLWHAP